jgi:hypothetical protein
VLRCAQRRNELDIRHSALADSWRVGERVSNHGLVRPGRPSLDLSILRALSEYDHSSFHLSSLPVVFLYMTGVYNSATRQLSANAERRISNSFLRSAHHSTYPTRVTSIFIQVRLLSPPPTEKEKRSQAHGNVFDKIILKPATMLSLEK